jgi:hypothetical protein
MILARLAAVLQRSPRARERRLLVLFRKITLIGNTGHQ